VVLDPHDNAPDLTKRRRRTRSGQSRPRFRTSPSLAMMCEAGVENGIVALGANTADHR
jgi:hypothetical protein